MAGNGKLHRAITRPSGTIRTSKIARRFSVAILCLIAGASLIGLVIAWSGNPTSATLRYEFAKTCMQVLALPPV